MTPLASEWSSLRSVVPNILQLGIIGYPFVNPGPVGGIGPANVSVSDNNGRTLQEDMELYIRWWQLNTFLPVLHYFKPPTAFPKKVKTVVNCNSKCLISIIKFRTLPKRPKSC